MVFVVSSLVRIAAEVRPTALRNDASFAEVTEAIFLATPFPKKQTKFLKDFCPSF